MNKISVIITTYNTPQEKLDRAIESVREQSVESEIVVVNDGGVTLKLPKGIIYVEHEKNYGGAKALNTGIKHAKGEYICVLDSDDEFIHRDKLKEQAEYLDANGQVGAVSSYGICLYRKPGIPIRRIEVTPELKPDIKHFLDTSPLIHSGTMFRESSLNFVKIIYGYIYDEKLKRGKDWDLFLRLGRFYELATIPKFMMRFEDVWVAEKRYEDAKVSSKILWRYRNYPRFTRNFIEAIIRLIYLYVRARI